MKMLKKWGLQLTGACLTLSTSTAFAAISNITVGSDATNAQYAYNYDGTPKFLRIYLDTDRVATSGYSLRGIGADYMIENGYLFKYSGTGGSSWAFTIVAPVTISVANQRVNWSVSRSAMGNPSGIYLIANYDTLDFSGIVSQTLSSTSTQTWTKCADENGTCNFTGSRVIRYGAQSSFVVKTLSGPVSCSNATFGDPLVGVQKYCELSSTVVSPTPTPTPVATPTPTPTPAPVDWVRCATENGTCSFSGTRNVRYGANGIYAYKVATSSIACNNATFGDPVVGVQKFCDYSSSTVVSPTPTPTPVASPTPTPTPSSTPSGSNSQVSYSISTAQMANPERGFYHDINCIGSAMSVSQLQGYRVNEGISLIHCYNNLSAFLNTTISASTLSLLDSNFAVLRSAGMKTVVRFVYTMNDNGADPTLSLLNTHMDQLAPYIAKNKDVISTIQIGFIGSWGEWANSIHFGVLPNLTSQNVADRKAITDKLLSIVPVDRTVQIRFPNQKMNMYGSSALSSTEAFTGTARARIGHHNDCFLTTSSDWGTYTNTTTQYPYLAEETKYVPMGGETCSYMAPRSDCPTALNETAMFHWSYLNTDYNQNVLNAWKTQGCFETIRQKLGYRFQLRSASLPTSARVGATVALSLNVENVGFASPFNKRGLELVLRNNSSGAVYKVALKADPRRWLPGSVIAVNENVVLPSSMPAGTYSLLLNLPDGEASLASRPEYSIQLANTNVWESNTGFNKLNANLVVNP